MYGKGMNKTKRIQSLFANKVGRLSKAEIAAFCPDISITTIEKTLDDLLKKEYIIKVGVGHSIAYIHNYEKEN